MGSGDCMDFPQFKLVDFTPELQGAYMSWAYAQPKILVRESLPVPEQWETYLRLLAVHFRIPTEARLGPIWVYDFGWNFGYAPEPMKEEASKPRSRSRRRQV